MRCWACVRWKARRSSPKRRNWIVDSDSRFVVSYVVITTSRAGKKEERTTTKRFRLQGRSDVNDVGLLGRLPREGTTDDARKRAIQGWTWKSRQYQGRESGGGRSKKTGLCARKSVQVDPLEGMTQESTTGRGGQAQQGSYKNNGTVPVPVLSSAGIVPAGGRYLTPFCRAVLQRTRQLPGIFPAPSLSQEQADEMGTKLVLAKN